MPRRIRKLNSSWLLSPLQKHEIEGNASVSRRLFVQRRSWERGRLARTGSVHFLREVCGQDARAPKIRIPQKRNLQPHPEAPLDDFGFEFPLSNFEFPN